MTVRGKLAAIVCIHVAREGYPICLAVKDEPIEAADSGWQFLCESGLDEPDAANIWSIDHVLQREPTLAPFLASSPGTVLNRSDASQPWTVHRPGGEQ